MFKIAAFLIIVLGSATLSGEMGLYGFRLPRIAQSDLDYFLMPFLGYLSICILAQAVALVKAKVKR